MENKKIDWVIHAVVNGVECAECKEVHYPYLDGFCDIHTHGLNKYGQTELQIVLNLDLNICGYTLNEMGRRVQNGIRYQDGDIVNELLSVPFKLKEFSDCQGNNVLRLIFPDKNGRFPEDDGCEEMFKLQHLPLSMLERENPHKIKS